MTTVITCKNGNQYPFTCQQRKEKGCIGCKHIETIERTHSMSLG